MGLIASIGVGQMVGERLHEFDLQLCEYVLGNIRQHCDWPDYLDLLGKVIDSAVLNYIREGLDPDHTQDFILLHSTELEGMWMGIQNAYQLDLPWRAWIPRHRWYIHTIKEIRDHLSTPIAEQWSRDCDEFSRRLEQRRVSLSQGIEIVGDWVERLREVLSAMGSRELLPYPEGRQPTPTNPNPPPPSQTSLCSLTTTSQVVDEQLADAVERMRLAIRRVSGGVTAKAATLIKEAKISNKRGREALRQLEASGDYHGFQRNVPDRYREDRPNER